MDGDNNGKPLLEWMYHYFWKHPWEWYGKPVQGNNRHSKLSVILVIDIIGWKVLNAKVSRCKAKGTTEELTDG